MTTKDPKRGEVWIVDLNPTIGSEIQKKRPVVVVSSDSIRKLPLRLVAPITEWKSHFEEQFWKIRLEPTATNGLSKVSAVDTLQLRGVDLQRFDQRLGSVDAHTMAEIAAAVALVVEFD